MRCTTRILMPILVAVFTLSLTAWAVMPPAPPEWYERLGVPIPDATKRATVEINPKIQADLDEAARLRPRNTDNILLILVEFTDNAANTAAHPPSAYEDLMFSTGVIPTESMYEYYQEISYCVFAV